VERGTHKLLFHKTIWGKWAMGEMGCGKQKLKKKIYIYIYIYIYRRKETKEWGTDGAAS
jgi:hypothetical protein